MRTRNRVSIIEAKNLVGGNVNYNNAYCDGTSEAGIMSLGSTLAIQPSMIQECIKDATGRGKANPCAHRSLNWRIFSVAGQTYPVASPKVGMGTYSGGPAIDYPWLLAWNHTSPARVWDTTSQTSLPPDWSINTTSINDDGLKNQVLEKAKQLKADALLNIVEASQLWPSVKSLATCIPEMAYQWKRIRKVLKTASGSFLAWKFGISPVLSDVENTHKYVGRLASDVERFASGEKQRFSIVAEVPALYNGVWTFQTLNGVETYRLEKIGKAIAAPIVRYVLVTKPNRKYLTKFFNLAETVMSRFASSPSSLAWELVPFSFVLDWFVDIRGCLTALDKAIGFEPYEIVSFTKSYSYHLQTILTQQRKHICSGALMSRGVEGIVEYKHYERSPVSGGHMPTWKPRFGKNQAGISAALIVQQLSRVAR